MQVALVARKRALAADAHGHPRTGRRRRSCPRSTPRLPFALTGDQTRAIAEITADLAAPAPMHRLLQGEVGSGKTVVALTALLTAVQGGYQGAFMAPTEVLAEQHELTMRALLDGLVVPGREHAARRTAGAGRAAHEPHARGRAAPHHRGPDATATVDIVVGTHALIYGGVEFARLGVAVIDEQHRFGVEQRDLLREQGRRARRARDDGDADPAHRGDAHLRRPRQDRAARAARRAARRSSPRSSAPARSSAPRCTNACAAEVAHGRQAYVVCPLVEGSDEARGARRDRGARAARGRGARRPPARPAPRPDAVGRQGGGDGRVPRRRRSTCSSRRR